MPMIDEWWPRLQRRNNPWIVVVVVLAFAFLFTGCEPIDRSATVSTSSESLDLSAPDIYRTVAPSVAFIETPVGTGSGIYTAIGDNTFVVTNDHVVWPYSAARVVFPDGTELLDVPVLQSDPLADLAILGPLTAATEPARLGATSEIYTGARVYLIGYPGEGELFPIPAISEGILARTRIWDSLDYTRYYQTDAAGAGGQSGGVLVAGDGAIIGISGLLFADEFVLAASTEDLTDRLAAMAAAGLEESSASRNRPGIDKVAALENSARRRIVNGLDSLWDTDGYLVDAPIDAEIEIQVESDADLGLFLLDSYPELLASADNTIEGLEVVSATASSEGPYFAVVEQYSPGSSTYTLEGSHRMTPITDIEDGLQLSAQTTIGGALDYPADIDWYVIPLRRGQSIFIAADAIFDTVLSVGPLGETSEAYVEDDDSGRGMLGSNAALEYRARPAGDYLVVVRSYDPEAVGGYLLSVSSTE